METREFLLHARLDAKVLDAWVEAGWLAPRRDAKASPFSEIDVARAQLIRDLRDDLGVNDEGVSVVLDLIDQVHGLRRMLRELVSAMQAPPDATRPRARAVPGGKRRRGSDPDRSR
jgi:chaperone modulatory protein CbpM